MNDDEFPMLRLIIYYITQLNPNGACFGALLFIRVGQVHDSKFIKAYFRDSFIPSGYFRNAAL